MFLQIGGLYACMDTPTLISICTWMKLHELQQVSSVQHTAAQTQSTSGCK